MIRLVIFMVLGFSAFTATADEPNPSADDRSAAVARGVEILLALQENLDGGEIAREWPYEGVYRVRDPQRERVIPLGYRIGGTAICAWALLEAPGWSTNRSSENPEGGSRRALAVERATGFILEHLRDDLMAPTFSGSYDVRGWGHTFALQFLLRLQARKGVAPVHEKAVGEAIPWLVTALEKTEIRDKGGWNYARGRGAGPSTFMTASTLLALLEAHERGFAVKPEVIERAIDALESGRRPTGAYQYKSDPPRATGTGFETVPGAVGRMAACETAAYLCGRGSAERLRGAVEAFFGHWQVLERERRKPVTHVPPYMVAPYYFYYAHFHAAQAIEFLPEKEREYQRQRLYRRLWQVREANGGWNDRAFDRSENFGTAMVILALSQPGLDRAAIYHPPDRERTRVEALEEPLAELAGLAEAAR